MRFTKKYDDGSYGLEKVNCEVEKKLGQLEDIEDEIGIDLYTLFKALKNGVYIKKQSQTKYPLALLRTYYSNHTTRYFVFENGKEKEIKLNKYGKTWALTKEELEDERNIRKIQNK